MKRIIRYREAARTICELHLSCGGLSSFTRSQRQNFEMTPRKKLSLFLHSLWCKSSTRFPSKQAATNCASHSFLFCAESMRPHCLPLETVQSYPFASSHQQNVPKMRHRTKLARMNTFSERRYATVMFSARSTLPCIRCLFFINVSKTSFVSFFFTKMERGLNLKFTQLTHKVSPLNWRATNHRKRNKIKIKNTRRTYTPQDTARYTRILRDHARGSYIVAGRGRRHPP